jgi:predicted Zn finger-like uncharacterized protein
MIVKVRCPHCRAEGYINTNWVKDQTDRVTCGHCENDFPAHLWGIVEEKTAKIKNIVKVMLI